MKRDMPTLADAMIATGYDKSMCGRDNPRAAMLRPRYLSVAYMRKIVLDDDMSAYLAELGARILHSGLRKRLNTMENLRHLSRLPHRLTWIEFNFRRYNERCEQLGCMAYQSASGKIPERVGWMLEQHPTVETAFRSTECRSMITKPNRGFVDAVSVQWTANEAPLAWQRLHLFEGETSADIFRMPYRTEHASWAYAFDNRQMNEDLIKHSIESEGDSFLLNQKTGEKKRAPGVATLPKIPIKDLWALLATINDLPVEIEHVEPSHGFMARGNYKKFLKHSIVHLTVPATRWRKLIAKVVALVRRRAHQVRGHWRDDWRHPLRVGCEHHFYTFSGNMVCQKCLGHKIWVREHVRGDASIGFVTHDYEVSKKTYPQA